MVDTERKIIEQVFVELPVTQIQPEFKFGWVPDMPDFRDFTMESPEIAPLVKKVARKPKAAALPATVDLRQWCSPVEDQGQLGSCTANAGAGIVEYFERLSFGKYMDGSRLFLYKTTRDLMHVTGDTGAWLRTVMKALRLFGLAPEEYWPYDIGKFDVEPPAFCYALADNYKAISYFRLDTPGVTKPQLVANIKNMLYSHVPAMFGFTVYQSYNQANVSGRFPFPTNSEKVVGGHAIVAVGYDDNMKIKNTNPGGIETTGAFLIRNSWGTGWGEKGYGWLPYEFVLKGLAVDWWCLLKADWVDSDAFK